jgi:hypothetical protein
MPATSFHKTLLTSPWKFKQTAMTKGWKEAKNTFVKLLEDDPDIFALYEQCRLYRRISVFHDKLE